MPEVQTILSGLQKTILVYTIVDMWTDLAVTNQHVPHFKKHSKTVTDSHTLVCILSGEKYSCRIPSENNYLTSVSGIGKKTAKKVVIELRDKLALFKTDENGFVLRGDSDVIEALKTLGYAHNEARDAVQKLPHEMVDVNTKIKEALKLLGK